jgi:ATP-binding cassette, subfamily B, bacterial
VILLIRRLFKRPQPSTTKALKWIYYTIRSEWKIALVSLVFMVIGAIIAPVPPLVLKEILDHGLQGTSQYSLLTLLIGYACLPLIMGIFTMGSRYYTELFTERTGNFLRSQLYRSILKKSLVFFIKNKSGQMQQRILQEPGQVNSAISSLASQFISSIFMTTSTLLTMLYLSPILTLIVIIFVPFTVLPGPISARWTVPLNVKAADVRAEASSKIQETLNTNGSLIIKLSGTRRIEINNFQKILREISRYNLLNVLWMEGTAVISNVIFVLGPVAIFWISSSEMGKTITVGTVIAFTTYLTQLSEPLKSISKVWAKIPWLITMINRLLEYKDDTDELKYPRNPVKLSNVQGEISFKDVTFYHEPQKPIINKISVKIKPGEVVALVGESGVGKTTFAYLMSRLCDPVKGQITLDGHDIRLFDPYDLSKIISFVPQEPYLFHTSIRDNIAYGYCNASEEDIIHAAKQAQIHDIIQRMPNKYDTIVGERGFKLSTGEKQRIALARVFLRDSKIVILDEVTSSLDAMSEAKVKKALYSLLKDRTALIIAHRLSTITQADRILVLNKGKIVEEGDFFTLLSNDGLFSRLYREQIGNTGKKNIDYNVQTHL